MAIGRMNFQCLGIHWEASDFPTENSPESLVNRESQGVYRLFEIKKKVLFLLHKKASLKENMPVHFAEFCLQIHLTQ